MLDLDTSAIRALAELQRSAHIPEGGGLRIALADSRELSRFTLALVPRAATGDHVVTAGDTKVFLTAPAADELGDRVLNATVDNDGTVRFGVHTRS
jgi:iron-sulfur cluster assembly protein